MMLDAQTKIEIAQINAGVGMHKTVVQAGTEHTKSIIGAQVASEDREHDAAIKAHQINTAAETARYAADNRPQPGAPAS
jgi:hypothetical protein